MLDTMRILVVEDDADIRNDLCDLLRGLGLFVEDATDARSAVELLRQGGRATVVLLDPLLANLEREQLREIWALSIATLTIPVAIDEVCDGARPTAIRRAAIHYGIVVEALREELRKWRTPTELHSGAITYQLARQPSRPG